MSCLTSCWRSTPLGMSPVPRLMHVCHGNCQWMGKRLGWNLAPRGQATSHGGPTRRSDAKQSFERHSQPGLFVHRRLFVRNACTRTHGLIPWVHALLPIHTKYSVLAHGDTWAFLRVKSLKEVTTCCPNISNHGPRIFNNFLKKKSCNSIATEIGPWSPGMS